MLQALPSGVFAHGFQNVSHRLLYPALLDRDFPLTLTLSQKEKEF